MASNTDDSAPLFCVKTKDLRTDRTLYVNFFASKSVVAPTEDITEDKIIRESFLQSPGLEPLIIPLQSSPIFWTKKNESALGISGTSDTSERDYVIDIRFNDRFVYRKVVNSEIVRHYAISVALSCIMDKFNESMVNKGEFVQYLGHKLELDQPNYKILEKQQLMQRSDEIVTNKIVVVEKEKEIPLDRSLEKASQEKGEEPLPYDLHLRPALGILTFSISTDLLPKSISFNDDRISVELDDKRVLDLILPISIDLTVPVKYKFDDRLCLFRAVFSTLEQ